MQEDIDITAYRYNVCNKFCSLGDTGDKSCSRSELKISTCISLDMMEDYEAKIQNGEG